MPIPTDLTGINIPKLKSENQESVDLWKTYNKRLFIPSDLKSSLGTLAQATQAASGVIQDSQNKTQALDLLTNLEASPKEDKDLAYYELLKASVGNPYLQPMVSFLENKRRESLLERSNLIKAQMDESQFQRRLKQQLDLQEKKEKESSIKEETKYFNKEVAPYIKNTKARAEIRRRIEQGEDTQTAMETVAPGGKVPILEKRKTFLYEPDKPLKPELLRGTPLSERERGVPTGVEEAEVQIGEEPLYQKPTEWKWKGDAKVLVNGKETLITHLMDTTETRSKWILPDGTEYKGDVAPIPKKSGRTAKVVGKGH